jgi:hypothetical protein
MSLRGSLVDRSTVRNSRAQALRRIRLTLLALALVGLGIGSVVAIQRIAVPPPGAAGLLTPAASGSQPGAGSAEQRAIALAIGETRSSDGMSFGEWYRARLSRLAPGIAFRYEALLSGNDACGEWSVYATVIPGPTRGPSNTTAILNQDGPVASVDEQTGRVIGLDLHTAGVRVFGIGTNCSPQTQSDGHTWLDQFRAGVAA